jgi:hypothetical protein
LRIVVGTATELFTGADELAAADAGQHSIEDAGIGLLI